MRNKDMTGPFANTTEQLHCSNKGNFMAGLALLVIGAIISFKKDNSP